MEERMARLCWNSNNWRHPSGSEGKSTDASSYEKINGFGHEEWLFDLDKIINGYHYGAIQPIGRNQDKYIGQTFRIYLYTYNSDDKEWYKIGLLNNVTAISTEEALSVYKEYERLKWLDFMKEDLIKVGANHNALNVFNKYCFNVKFQPNEFKPIYNGLQLFNSDQHIPHNRYTLLKNVPNLINSFETSKIEITEHDINIKHKRTFTRSFEEYSKEYTFIHGILQDAFFDYLRENYPSDYKKKEKLINGLNCLIDIYQKKKTGVKIIYEIKTYIDLRYSIRIALGQLLEYCYYPDRTENYKLVIISNKFITNEAKQYIDNLKAIFKLDIGIINFNSENKRIEEKYNCDERGFI